MDKKKLVFPSIQYPDRRYVWYESSYDSPGWTMDRGRWSLDEHAFQYETLGDGECQHSNDCVVSRDLWIDYLTSLGAYLVDNPKDAEVVASNWPHGENIEQVRFALSLCRKEGKVQYYNLDECKLSSSDSKRHDKRWKEVESWHDQTMKSAYAVLCQEWYGTLRRYSLLSAILNEANKASHRYYWSDVFTMIGVGTGEDRYHSNGPCAYNIVDFAVQSWRMHDSARRNLQCQRNNWIRNVLGR